MPLINIINYTFKNLFIFIYRDMKWDHYYISTSVML
jgi:hypothetical protein